MSAAAVGAPIGVFIVDDSAVVRQHLAARLRESGFTVLGAVADPVAAIDRMRRDWPDVVILDPELPGHGGTALVQQIMSTRPTPVVLCASPTASATRAALAAGSAALVAKPASDLKAFLESDSSGIVEAVRQVAVPSRPVRRTASAPDRARVIAVGTSTGGTQALEVVLPRLRRDTSGVVIVQHMPERFTAAFAERLDAMCEVRVAEAANGDQVTAGRVLVAPGGRHMELVGAGTGYRVRVFDAPPVNRHRPSVDVLFRSVARSAGVSALGVIMTGMGDDGAQGLLAMHRAGAFTVAQDEATCVVHGMPQEAVRLGAVDRETPLGGIAEMIQRHG